jgi:hypothetical protein
MEGAEMNRKLTAVFALAIISFILLALPLATATAVFSDNFSQGNFANWTKTYIGPGSSQTVSNGVARFTVPTPMGGSATYSFILKDGFTSTVNSKIIATEDIYVTKVPNGCPQGEGGIFFFYICDSTDLTGNHGNFGVGIDGSDAWSIWIGGNPIYNYVFQTSGVAPVSNTWYHLVLTVDNAAGTVTLSVNGGVVICASQQQFTDRVHVVSLMTGMGEDWWCQGVGLQEIDVANVKLDISDESQMPTPVAEPTTTPTTPPSTSSPNLAPAPNQNTTASPSVPSTTQKNSPSASPTTIDPMPTSSTTPTTTRAINPANSQPTEFPLWIVLVVTVAVVVFATVIILVRKR